MPITETGEHGLERLKVATRLGAFIRFYCVPVYGSPTEYPFSVDFSSADIVGATKTNLKYLMSISGGPAEVVPDEGQSSIGGYQLGFADIDGEFFRYLCEPALTLQSTMTDVSPGVGGVITVSSVAGLPSKGTIRITTGAVDEKIRYSSKNTVLNQLTVSARGVDGTTAAAHAIDDPLTNNEVIRPGARAEIFTGYQALDEIKYLSRTKMEVTGRKMGDDYTSFIVDISDVMWSFVREIFTSATQATPVILTGNPLTLLLRVLLSTGTGTNGPYDVLGLLNGLGIPQDRVDVAGVEALRDADFLSDSYSFTIVAPEDAKTWIEREILKTLNCVVGRTPIETDSGHRRINEIVSKRLPVRVRTFNTRTGALEWGRVVNWIKRPAVTEWIRLHFIGPVRSRQLTVTPDHRLWSRDGMKSAERFALGDELFVSSPTLSQEQEQVILGSLLGDGSLQMRRSDRGLPVFQEHHSIKQLDYLTWKGRALGSLGPRMRKPFIMSTFLPQDREKPDAVKKSYEICALTTRHLPCLIPIADVCLQNGRKHVTYEWLSRIGILGLAVWLMDDGTINVRRHRRPRIFISLAPSSPDEIAAYRQYFRKSWGVEVQIRGCSYSRGLKLVLGADVSAEILLAVAPYLVVHPSEAPWKRWVAGNILQGEEYGIVPAKITKIERVATKPKMAYDITVEPAHTFFANRVVSSNCYPVIRSGKFTVKRFNEALLI